MVGGTAGGGRAASARIDGVGLLTWREHVVPADAERIYLGQPPGDGALWLPAAAGVLLAGCVIVDLTRDHAPGRPAPWRPGRRLSGGSQFRRRRFQCTTVRLAAARVQAVRFGQPGCRWLRVPAVRVPGVRTLSIPVRWFRAESGVEDSPDAGAAVGAPAQPDATEDRRPRRGPERASAGPQAGRRRRHFRPARARRLVPAVRRLSRPGRGVFRVGAGRAVGDRPALGTAVRLIERGVGRLRRPDSGPDSRAAAPPEPEGADGLIDAVPWGAGPGAPAAPLAAANARRLAVAPPPAPAPEEDGLTVKRRRPGPAARAAAGPRSARTSPP